MKLYTENQILNAYYNGWHYRSVSFVNGEVGKFPFYRDEFINSLTPIELPSDDEIKQEADSYHGLESYNTTFVQGAKWMRDKIQGCNNDQKQNS